MDRGVKKVHDYLKANDLLAVPFDKGCGICVMKKSTYMEKLDEVLNSDQFQKINGTKDDIVIKNEKQIYNSLQQLSKLGKFSEKIYQRLRSPGSQPARLFGLAKVHKNDTPLRPVLSIPGSSYENFKRFLTPFFQKLPGANIETITQDARKALESLTLEDDEQIVSLAVKSGKKFVHQRSGWGGYRNCSKRTLFKQPSFRYPEIRHEKFAKACGDQCSFKIKWNLICTIRWCGYGCINGCNTSKRVDEIVWGINAKTRAQGKYFQIQPKREV